MKYIKKFENDDWEYNIKFLWEVKIEMCKIWNISGFGIAEPNEFHLNKDIIYDYFYQKDKDKYPKNANEEYEKMKSFLINKGFKRKKTLYSGNPNKYDGDIYECDRRTTK